MDLQTIRKSIAAEIKRLQKVYDALDLRPRKSMSTSARRKISTAEKARWAEVRGKKGVAKGFKYKKGTHWTQRPENKAKLRLVTKA